MFFFKHLEDGSVRKIEFLFVCLSFCLLYVGKCWQEWGDSCGGYGNSRENDCSSAQSKT